MNEKIKFDEYLDYVHQCKICLDQNPIGAFPQACKNCKIKIPDKTIILCDNCNYRMTYYPRASETNDYYCENCGGNKIIQPYYMDYFPSSSRHQIILNICHFIANEYRQDFSSVSISDEKHSSVFSFDKGRNIFVIKVNQDFIRISIIEPKNDQDGEYKSVILKKEYKSVSEAINYSYQWIDFLTEIIDNKPKTLIDECYDEDIPF